MPFSSRISCAPGVAAISPTSWVATTMVVPSRLSAREQVEQTRRHFGIDVAGRLVGDKQLGLADDRPRDRDALLLAARQGRRPRARPIGKPDPGKHFPHRSFELRVALARNPQRQRDIVEGRQVADQAEVLEHDADPAAKIGKDVARRVGQVLPNSWIRPRVGRCARYRSCRSDVLPAPDGPVRK